MAKQIKYGVEARKALEAGVNQILHLSLKELLYRWNGSQSGISSRSVPVFPASNLFSICFTSLPAGP